MSLDDIASVNITATTTSPSRQGFGTPLIAACRVPFITDRVRSYQSLTAMATDGFASTDPAYLAASAMWAQNPRPPTIKVGRRASNWTQVIDLTPVAPATGLEYALTINGHAVTSGVIGASPPTLAEACTAIAVVLNAANDEDDDAIITARASSGSIQTITGTGLNGAVGQRAMSPARPLELIVDNSTDWDATTAVVTGTDSAGHGISENFAIPNGSGSGSVPPVLGTKLFATVTQVVIPAQSGTGGSFHLGVQKRFNAAATSTKVTVTATSAAQLQSYDLRLADGTVSATLALSDATTLPTNFVDDLTAISLADPDWYALCLDSNSAAELAAAEAYIENCTPRRMFAGQSADSACLDPSSITDVMYLAKATNYFRTWLAYYPGIGLATSWIAAAMLGSRLPIDPGSDTWAFKSLSGVRVYTLTDTQKQAILAKSGNTYLVTAGVPITQNGKVAAGEWADVTRGLDWLRARMQERLFGLLVNGQKLPYTDASVDLVKAELLAQLNEGVRVSFLRAGTVVVSAPLVASIDSGTRALRSLPGVQFSAQLAGAIHVITVNGTVSP